MAIALLIITGTAVVIFGNTYRYAQREVSIPVGAGQLSGVLITPRDGRPRGLVVMVHGDAAVEATMDGLYGPWFEGAADSGWATLSWSKPGVGGSDGDWLRQSMADRAAEVSAVLDWARSRPELPTGRVVLWGASQAGWVLPKVVAARSDLDGVVAVGTAINWLRQGRYHLEAGLADDDAGPAERAAAITDSERTVALLERGASHEEYRAATADPDPMPPARWGFVGRNFRSDATADLSAAAKRGIPWSLMIGDHDRNVDVAETERVYRTILGSQVTPRRFAAAHSMARPVMEDSAPVGFATGVVWPRALLAPQVIEHYRATLDALP
ncbi:alpha/beta hydrolase family protein [Microlunatus speluncae]|uniref:alpha/beta hydrolase family protein n=1 Tax=Microlunatus speluncae TaxID=2594267 RepID=UPI001C2DEB4E|nr:alpha/beta hydrolase [Microlunatus speluncae]